MTQVTTHHQSHIKGDRSCRHPPPAPRGGFVGPPFMGVICIYDQLLGFYGKGNDTHGGQLGHPPTPAKKN